ncbi:MAG TPA: type I-B CRISPR-associated protein Cas5b [Ignavibacteria bacterium]
MDKVIVFDIWGNYAHFKKIYSTTSALTYPIPLKTSIYGYVSSIIGGSDLDKNDNKYLESFKEGLCKIGIQIMSPLIMQRINTNLRPKFGSLGWNDNRKPTMMEYVYNPKYRIYFYHSNNELYNKLKINLEEHKSFYTPVLGLAYLISNFEYIDECEVIEKNKNELTLINSVIPKSFFLDFDIDSTFDDENEIVEINQYAVEMDNERNVTKRDDILFDRKAKPIKAKVIKYYEINYNGKQSNIILF